jgi:hypothetical protein
MSLYREYKNAHTVGSSEAKHVKVVEGTAGEQLFKLGMAGT